MAKERVLLTRNVGTVDSPVWEKWYAKTIADAVLMSDADGETKNIKQYVDEKISALIGTATPETLDTLEEIAGWIESHEEVAAALNNAIATKADKDHDHADATQSKHGFMSTADKTKLDGIATGANKYIHPSQSGITANASGLYKVTLDSNGHVTANSAVKKSDIESLGFTGTSELVYTNAEPTVSAHGGIAAGSTFNKVSIFDMFTRILYPYVAPVVSATIVTPSNGGVKECGDTQTVTKIRAVVTKKSASITKVEVKDGSTVIATKTDGVANGGTFDFTVNRSVNTNKSYSVVVTDSENKTVTASTGAFTFVYPYYYGVVSASATLNEATIEGLTKKVETKGTKTLSYTANNQRCVIAYPKSYGVLKTIFDPNNFNVTDTFTMSEVSITGLDRSAQAYYVYVNDPATVSAFNFKFGY